MNEATNLQAALSQFGQESELMGEALYALHVQQTHLQAVLCALIDTHPDAATLLTAFRSQLDRTTSAVKPRDPQLFADQRAAWEKRIQARLVLASHCEMGEGTSRETLMASPLPH